uniref:Structural polyprotein n=1 Tax=Wenling fish alphavirus TaxID=2116464 RepID=A0A2P1GN83_9VIRU|nr:structural polyprotein [Wenling fish alphavirus]
MYRSRTFYRQAPMAPGFMPRQPRPPARGAFMPYVPRAYAPLPVYRAPPRRRRNPRPPRAFQMPMAAPMANNQLNALTQQMQQLTMAVACQSQPQYTPRPRNRRNRRGKKKQGRTRSQNQRTNDQPQNARKRGRVGKNLRIAVERTIQHTLEVKDTKGTVQGYAIMIGTRLFKPNHVKGTVDHPLLKEVRFKKAADLDLDMADLPPSLHQDAGAYTKYKEGAYTWRHGVIQIKDDVVHDVGGKGKNGDSGLPILDNSGKIAGMVLGGVREHNQNRLSILAFNNGNAKQIECKDAVNWCARPTTRPIILALCMAFTLVTACTNGGTRFTCSAPECGKCCIDTNEATALRLLQENLDDPNYLELLFALTECPKSGRIKRSTEKRSLEDKMLNTHAATVPFAGQCPECGSGPCVSIVPIESIHSVLDSSLIRIRVGAQFGVDHKGKAAARTSVRFSSMTGTIVAEEHSALTVSASGMTCTVERTHGHFIVANCPAGDHISVSILAQGARHSCTIPYTHEVLQPYQREIPSGHYNVKAYRQCARYATKLRREDISLLSAYPSAEHYLEPGHNDIISILGTNQLNVTIPAGVSKLYVKTTCGGTTANKEYETSAIINCNDAKYDIPRVRYTKPHLLSVSNKGIAASDSVAISLVYPYPVTRQNCAVSQSKMPPVTPLRNSIKVAGRAEYPVRVTSRRLGGSPNHTDEWVHGHYELHFPVGTDGVEVRWGNNDPIYYWAEYDSKGDPAGYPWEIFEHHADENPIHAWSYLAVICVLFLALLTIIGVLWSRLRHTMVTNRGLQMHPEPLSCIMALLCCLPSARADTPGSSFLSAMGYLWDNNQYMFWAQFLAPISALTIMMYCCKLSGLCCKSFLVMAALLAITPQSSAYEHTATVAMDPRAQPYEAVIQRKGFEPVALTIKVVSTMSKPLTNLEYWTCTSADIVQPPNVCCCCTTACPSDITKASAFKNHAVSDAHCLVSTGVYPYLWGPAHCFCTNENTQTSIVAATVDETCTIDRAEAFTAHGGSYTADLNVKIGTADSLNITAYVDGVTPARAGDSVLLVGPLSTVYSPFDTKIVRYAGELYNYAWPPYAAPQAGTFGDLQSRSQDYRTPGDLVANKGIVLHKPQNTYVHVSYESTEPGLARWLRDKPVPLTVQAQFGCLISADPIAAKDCGVGIVPLSIDIPDAVFTRVVVTPHPVELRCEVLECTFGADMGAIMHLTFRSADVGKCGVHSPSGLVTIKSTVLEIKEGTNEATIPFSASKAEQTFQVKVCGASTACSASCKPPDEHVKPVKPHHSGEGGDVTGPAMAWGFGLFGTILMVAIIFLAIWMAVRCARSKTSRVVK